MMNKIGEDSKILVLGSRDLVGASLVRELAKAGYKKVLTPSSEVLNLLSQRETLKYFEKHAPDFVFFTSGKRRREIVNDQDLLNIVSECFTVQSNIFSAAHKYSVKGLMFFGDNCVYPKNCQQPIKEEYLLTSSLESEHQAYAIAKIAGIKTVESFRRQYGHAFLSVIPANLYGINDIFDVDYSDVIPALMRRMYESKLRGDQEFVVWGTGSPFRQFLYVDDYSRACILLMNNIETNQDLINVANEEVVQIKDLSVLIQEVVGFQGKLKFDIGKKDGSREKFLDVSKVKELGWRAQVNLVEGLSLVYADFLGRYGERQRVDIRPSTL